MGLNHRYGVYMRRVWIGKRTIKDGEAAVIWSRSGKSHVAIGPKVRYLWFSTIRFMDRFVATADEYLAVQYRDGRRETLRGPIEMFCDPTVHEFIKMEPAIALLSENDVVVLASSQPGPGASGIAKGSRAIQQHQGPLDEDEASSALTCSLRVVRGPAMVVPENDEKAILRTLIDGSSSIIIPTGRNTLAEGFAVRLADGSRCTIKVAVDVAVADVEHMVRTTADPGAQLKAALHFDLAKAASAVASVTVLDTRSQGEFIQALDVALADPASTGFKHTHATARRLGLALSESRVEGIEGLDGEYERLLMEKERNRAAMEAVRAKERVDEIRWAAERRRLDEEHKLRDQEVRLAEQVAEFEFERELDRASRRLRQQMEMLRTLHEMGVQLTSIIQPIRMAGDALGANVEGDVAKASGAASARPGPASEPQPALLRLAVVSDDVSSS